MLFFFANLYVIFASVWFDNKINNFCQYVSKNLSILRIRPCFVGNFGLMLPLHPENAASFCRSCCETIYMYNESSASYFDGIHFLCDAYSAFIDSFSLRTSTLLEEAEGAKSHNSYYHSSVTSLCYWFLCCFVGFSGK